MKMATLLNFNINPSDNNYISEDPEKLEQRINNVVRMATRNEITKMELEEVLVATNLLSITVLDNSKKASIMDDMGIDLLTISFNSIKPEPIISKALEAEYRENLQRKADEAIYARRAAAVEQERKIQENQLNNQIAVEKKRKELIQLEGENKISQGKIDKEITELGLEPYKDADTKTLLALAIRKLAENNNIGNLTITSEILSSLLNDN